MKNKIKKAQPPKELGFYLAKSNKGFWYTVFAKRLGDEIVYSYTSERYGMENMPSIKDFVEWVKVQYA